MNHIANKGVIEQPNLCPACLIHSKYRNKGSQCKTNILSPFLLLYFPSVPQENLLRLVNIEYSVRGQRDLLQPGRVSSDNGIVPPCLPYSAPVLPFTQSFSWEI